MAQAVFSYRDTEAKVAKPLAVTEIIRSHLRSDECWGSIEPYIMPPGVAGSKYFDQALAVEALLTYDAEKGKGALNAMMNKSPQLSRRVLWDRLHDQIRKGGFKMQHGRLIGLLEDHVNQEDNGHPDVD